MTRSNTDQARAILNSVIIEAQDGWSWGCRQLVLHSATGKAMSRKGRRILRPTISTGGLSPINYLRRNWAAKKMGSSWEPDWFLPANAIRAATILGVPNLAEITAGLGAAIVHEHLRTVRNVVAHSVPNTWTKYQKLESTVFGRNSLAPPEFVIAINPSSGRRHIFEWLEELEICLQWAAD